MGPLFGLIFTELGKASAEKSLFGLTEFSAGLNAAMNKIMELGGAKPGDKTMIDAMYPVCDSLDNSTKLSEDFSSALKKAENAARLGVESTIPLLSRRGRSKYLREKSIGYQDAGATSFYYLILTVADFVRKEQQ